VRYRAPTAEAWSTAELKRRARSLSSEIIDLAAKGDSSRLIGLAVRLAAVVNQLYLSQDPVQDCLEIATEAKNAPSGTSAKGMLAALRRYRELGCPELPSEPDDSDDDWPVSE
jgi:hypothetical protein